VADLSAAVGQEATLYDVLATPVPEGLDQGETRITRAAPETSDEAPSVFPGAGLDA
jgi:hypothetical protein